MPEQGLVENIGVQAETRRVMLVRGTGGRETAFEWGPKLAAMCMIVKCHRPSWRCMKSVQRQMRKGGGGRGTRNRSWHCTQTRRSAAPVPREGRRPTHLSKTNIQEFFQTQFFLSSYTICVMLSNYEKMNAI